MIHDQKASGGMAGMAGMVGSIARVTVAALAAGLSLLGPQVCGVAGAESGGNAASSEASPAVEKQAAVRSGAARSSRAPAGDSTPAERWVTGRAAGARQPAAPASRRVPGAGVVSGDSGGAEPAGPVVGSAGVDPGGRTSPVDVLSDGGLGLWPTAAEGSGRAASVAVAAPAAAAPVVSSRIGRGSATALFPGAQVSDAPAVASSLGQAVGDLSDAVVGLIDGLRTVLATLPGNPFSELFSGALYLVRRALRPVGSGVGLFGAVPCVATGNCSGQDLTGADLSGRSLTALDFSRAVLNGVDFSGADLSQADLSVSQLRAANLTDANLLHANLMGADLVGADLDGVTNFGTATLTGADLSGQILIRLDLSGKDLTGTDFGGAILSGTDLSGTELAQANFEGAKLAGVDLSSANLTGAVLDLADLSDVTWGDTPCPADVDCAPGDDATATDTGGGAVVDPGPLGSDPGIATNTNFSYADAILAARFSELAYKWRERDFQARIEATGWRGISPSQSAWTPGGFTTRAGGYGVGDVVYGYQDGMPVQSFAFAGRRTAGDGTEQFVFAVEGSNSCSASCLIDFRWLREPGQDRADWNANIQSYGWSRYYASLQPLMAEVLRQMIDVQKSGKKAQLIITGHSLGGATAMIAYADLLAPKGDLYPAGQTDVLTNGKRIWDKIGDWTPATVKAIQDVATVYTFGAPSPLIEPVKDPGGLNGVLAKVVSLDYKKFWEVITSLFVNSGKLPEPFRGGTVDRIFQFEHKGGKILESLLPDYADDVVADIGDRDPGTIIPIRLRPDVHEDYVGFDGGYCGSCRPVSAATHGIGLYNESLIRLTTWDALLDNSTPVEGVVGSPTSGGKGSDGRNDVFREMAVAGSLTVTSAEVTNRGSGYNSLNPPEVRLEGGGGTGATARAVVPDRVDPDGYYVDYVTEVIITNPGSGYTSEPKVIIDAPSNGGTQAEAVAIFSGIVVNAGKGGNDWYAPALAGPHFVSYLTDGGPGSDLYALYQTSLGVTVDGRSQSGIDGVIFYGTPDDVRWTRSSNFEVTYYPVSGKSVKEKGTALLIKNWDRWAPSDVFYTKKVDGRLSLVRLPDIKVGPTS